MSTQKRTPLDLARFTFVRLSRLYPNADIQLNFGNEMQLLVAVILSAQCTDKRVNAVTASLFKYYKTAEDFARATQEKFEEEIRSCGLQRSKTRNIIETAKILWREFSGKVPSRYEDLIRLPGVGRKTANVVRSVGFCEAALAVDTHVKRVALRIGLTQSKDPLSVEKDLCRLFPRENWKRVHHLLIFHGRSLCRALSPLCPECPLHSRCHYFQRVKRNRHLK